MSNLNKIFIGFFIILLIITIGELGYYFLFSNTGDKKTALIPTLKEDFQRELVGVQNYRKDIDEGALISSHIINKYQGTIVEIQKNISRKNRLGKTINVALNIKLQYSAGRTEDFYFVEKQLTYFKLYSKSQPIAIADLKKDDRVTIEITYDELKDYLDRIISVRIDKI